MFMILVAAMISVNPQKIKKSCGASVLNIVLSKPITFMKLVSESGCATETVEKYVKSHLSILIKYVKKKVNLEFFILQY